MHLNLEQRQSQQISQNQIEALSLLAMTNAELETFLEEEYLENPLFEDAGTNSVSMDLAFDDYAQEYRRQSEEAGDDEAPVRDLAAPAERILEEELLYQLDLSSYTRQQMKILRYLIDCLDGQGYFKMSLEEAAEKLQVPLYLVRDCLSDLKKLEPYGIFSADLKESLIRQLEASGQYTEQLGRIIQDHLEDVASGKIGNISRSLQISTARVREAISLIASLRPYPLQGYGSAAVMYIIPDVIAARSREDTEDGKPLSASGWTVRLNEANKKEFRLNEYYLHMMETAEDPELLEYFKRKLARAQFIFSSIEQRKNTILAVAEEILRRQDEYFSGTGPLRAMTMQEVAVATGMHTSTVSRAVRDKYLQYPGGTVLLRELFSSVGAESGDATPDMVKELIREMVQNEDKRKPLSDQVLEKKMREKGITVSRRTVAKYREELGIPSSVLRKDI